MTGDEIAHIERIIQACEAPLVDAVRQLQADIAALAGNQSTLLDGVSSLQGMNATLINSVNALAERIARAETRIEALTGAIGQMSARLTVTLDVDLAEIKGRLARLSQDIMQGRTLDTDRVTLLEKRVEALEARLHPHG